MFGKLFKYYAIRLFKGTESRDSFEKKPRQKRTDLGQKKGGDRFLNISEFLLVLYQNYKLCAVKCEKYAGSLCLLGFFASLTQ
jgi:hypothetical protein